MQRLFDKHWDNMASVKNMIKITFWADYAHQRIQMNSDKENNPPLFPGTA